MGFTRKGSIYPQFTDVFLDFMNLFSVRFYRDIFKDDSKIIYTFFRNVVIVEYYDHWSLSKKAEIQSVAEPVKLILSKQHLLCHFLPDLNISTHLKLKIKNNSAKTVFYTVLYIEKSRFTGVCLYTKDPDPQPDYNTV